MDSPRPMLAPVGPTTRASGAGSRGPVVSEQPRTSVRAETSRRACAARMTTSWLSNAARRLPAPGRVATIVRGTHALLILRSADPHAQAPNLRRAGPHGHRGGPGAHASPSARAARGP